MLFYPTSCAAATLPFQQPSPLTPQGPYSPSFLPVINKTALYTLLFPKSSINTLLQNSSVP